MALTRDLTIASRSFHIVFVAWRLLLLPAMTVGAFEDRFVALPSLRLLAMTTGSAWPSLPLLAMTF